MTFTLEQARQLRDSLPAMDFQASVSDDPLIWAYLAHYGLDRLRYPWPVRHCLGGFPSQQYRLAGQFFAVPEEQHKGTVLVVHGYYDHVGLFGHPIEFCISRGYSVLAFDLPGHGLSDGDPAGIGSFDHYSRALTDCLDLARRSGVRGPWHVLAQSTGAAALLNCLLKAQRFPLHDLHKIILLAPLLRPVDWSRGLLKFWLIRWFVKRVDRDFAVNSHDAEFLRFIAEDDPLQARDLRVDWVRSLKHYLADFGRAPRSQAAIRVVQGTEDTTVDWRYNLPALCDKFPEAQTHLIEGARHHLVNESEPYRSKLFAVIEDILAQ